MSHQQIEEFTRCVEEALSQGAFGAAQTAVIVDDDVVHQSAHGGDPNGVVTHNSIFDVASLTKMVCTTTVAAILTAEERLGLNQPVASYVPAFAARGKGGVTVGDLLAHRSGLAAWEPLFLEAMGHPVAGCVWPASDTALPSARRAAFAASRQLLIDRVLATPLVRPQGERVYSDLGFIALGHLCEVVTRKSLDRLFAQLIAAPLGLERTGFFDLAESRGAFAAFTNEHVVITGNTRPREPVVGQTYSVPPQTPRTHPGHVDDDNAYALGGVAGHAGLFSTAVDLARFGAALIAEIHGANRLSGSETLAQFAQIDTQATGPKRALGFDVPTGHTPSAGAYFGKGPRGAIGHLGFTGCSLWVDLDARLSVALLTNRVFPSRQNTAGIKNLRPRFHDLVYQTLCQ